MASSKAEPRDDPQGPLPTTNNIRDAFEKALMSVNYEDSTGYASLLNWAEGILEVFTAMLEILKPPVTGSQGQNPHKDMPRDRFFSILQKWALASLDPALALLSNPSPNFDKSMLEFPKLLQGLQDRYMVLKDDLQLLQPPTPYNSSQAIEPLMQNFLMTLFSGPTPHNIEVQDIYKEFLDKLNQKANLILPNCIVVCFCHTQEPGKFKVIGTSNEKWTKHLGRKKHNKEYLKQIAHHAALDHMIKDVRFHWLVNAHLTQQDDGEAEMQVSLQHIKAVRYTGNHVKELLGKGQSSDEIKTQISKDKTLISSFLSQHSAIVLDGISGEIKARCAKCRILFERKLSQEQQSLEEDQRNPKTFTGLSCAEDIAVALCREEKQV